MGDSRSITHGIIPLFLLIGYRNKFPISEDEYLCSKWFKWIERINSSHKDHCTEIDNKYLWEENDEPKICGVTIDHLKSIGYLSFITEGMFASLIVSMQSYIEQYYFHVCDILNFHTNGFSALPTHNQVQKCKTTNFLDVQKYMKGVANIDIRNVEFADIANAVRVLSNTYKHDNGIYKAKKNNIIPENLANSWGIKRNNSVIYSEFKFSEISIGCGKYCNKLKGEVEAVLKR